MTGSNHERIRDTFDARITNRETIELDAVAGNRDEGEGEMEWKKEDGERNKHRDKGQDQSTKDRLSSAIIHPR